jgi:hypothetical protein
MGLFEKKYCSICGEQIGFLGNRKLEDGNMCKNCSAKLSPWFTGRRKTTVEDIRRQLSYRESNASALVSFTPTEVIEGKMKVFLDDVNRRFAVTRSKDLKNNPDLVKYSQVKDVTCEIKEDKEEIFQTVDGKKTSYVPPKYEYEYTFRVTIDVDSPWFDEISFDVDEGDKIDVLNGEAYQRAVYIVRYLQHKLLPEKYPDPGTFTVQPGGGDDIVIPEDVWVCECGSINRSPFCPECGKPRPAAVWYCPECGAENHSKFCVKCGTKRPE